MNMRICLIYKQTIGKIRTGKNVTICANAVVVNDMPDNCICSGIPARVIKMKEKLD